MAGVRCPSARCTCRSWARALPLALLAAMTYLALPGVAGASSQQGDIFISPTSGPVGTKVHVEIAVEVGTTTIYALTATQNSPQSGGCAQSQPIPGVPPFAVPPPNPSGVGPYQMEFTWPAALDQGPYWLCAAPTTGSGPTAQSADPFTVTSAHTPTPTPTASGVPLAATTMVITVVTTPPAASGTSVASLADSSSLPSALIVGVVAALLVVAAALLALSFARHARPIDRS